MILGALVGVSDPVSGACTIFFELEMWTVTHRPAKGAGYSPHLPTPPITLV